MAENNYRRDDEEKNLKNYLNTISRIPLLKSEEEYELAKRYRENGDEEALNKLIVSNLRFVVTLANKFKITGMSLLDLIHEGNIGLIIAAKRYDPAKKKRLITYAKWWILQSIERAIQNQGTPIKLPVQKTNKYLDILKAQNELKNRFNREPTKDEVADKANISKEDFEKIIRAKNSVLSLDEPLLQDDETEIRLEDVLEETNSFTADDFMMAQARGEILRKSLSILSDKERAVITLKYGLNDNKERTLSEVGKELKLSRERVRQLEKSAIQKLRRSQHIMDLLRSLN